MAQLQILELLEKQGHSKYWLCKRLEMHYTSFNKMVNNETTSIRFDTLDRMSKIMDVPVRELFKSE